MDINTDVLSLLVGSMAAIEKQKEQPTMKERRPIRCSCRSCFFGRSEHNIQCPAEFRLTRWGSQLQILLNHC